ncbi:MAG TPA: NUDIX hydrolase [Terracidiphilus sp.]|nr:NUDIX hydrolase [Terracidiphilus sp.]
MPGKAKRKKSAGAKKNKAKTAKIPRAKKSPKAGEGGEKAKLVSSEVVFEGRLFKVVHDKVIEPGGHENERDIVRHNGSAVILAIDNEKNRKNPWVVMERQYRHAAGRFLWELPAGKIEPEEDPLAGAKRELAEETGYRARKWSELAQFWPSPGFVGEWMKLFLAEGLTAGDSLPEEDERIELRLVRLNDVLKMIDKGAIQDGKTLAGILLFARLKPKARKNKK